MTDGYGIFNVHTHSLHEELHDGLSPKYKIHMLRPAKFKLAPMAREPGFSRGKLHTLTQTQLGQFPQGTQRRQPHPRRGLALDP